MEEKTPLHIAAEKGNCDKIIELFCDVEDLDAVDENGSTPFLSAIECGQFKAMVLIKELGATTTLANKKGHNAMHTAACQDNVKIIDKLVDWGFSVIKSGPKGYKPMHVAAKKGKVAAMKRLHHHGARYCEKGQERTQPIHTAACYGQLNVVKFLIDDCLVHPDAENESGLSTLFFATMVSQVEIVKFILEKGANVHWRMLSGMTLLHIAAAANCIELVRIYCKAGVDSNIKDEEKDTALSIAYRYGRDDILIYLNGIIPNEHKQSLQPERKKIKRNSDSSENLEIEVTDEDDDSTSKVQKGGFF